MENKVVFVFDYCPRYDKGIVTCTNKLWFDNLREFFSVPNEEKKFLSKKNPRRRFLPDRFYFITPAGRFDLGLINEIKTFINNQHELTPDIQYNPNIVSRLKNIELSVPSEINWLNKTPRDYQKTSILRSLKAGWGITEVGTGGGKTYIMGCVIENLFIANKHFKQILIIVPKLDLVRQTYSDFKSYGMSYSISQWTGNDDPDLNANVIIANQAILVRSKLDECEWIKNVDAVFIDEVHGLKRKTSILEFVSQIPTHHKFGYTGTLPENELDRWSIIGRVGPITFKKPSFELRNEGTLVNVEIYILKITYTNPSELDYQKEIDFIYNHSFRNKLICSIPKKVQSNTLMLVNHIIHGETLLEQMKKAHPDREVFFMRGSMEVDERVKIKEKMETQNNIICIAMSSIFSTGINIQNLHCIVFCAAGKSFIRTVQSIGRGLRKHPSKNKLIIFDIYDYLKYGIRHAQERMRIYKKENISYKIVDV